MILRQLINTNYNDGDINIYLSSEAFDDLTPDYTTSDARKISTRYLNQEVLAWFVDANFTLHVLIDMPE